MTIATSGSRVSVFARLGKRVDPPNTDTCNNYSRNKSWKNADSKHSTNGRKIVNPKDVTVVNSLNLKQSTCSKSVDPKQSASCNSKILNHSISGNSMDPKQSCVGSTRLGGSPNQQLQEKTPRRIIAKSDLLEPKKEEPVESTAIKDAQPKQSTSHVEEDRSVSGNKCASSHGSGLIPLAKLKGHHKTITGIALPCGSSTLYTVSEDNCLRAWDCHTGQCAGTEVLTGRPKCMVTKDPWLFAGLPNIVKAWNLPQKTDYSLNAIGGQVHSLEFDNDILFAGMEDGSILVWRWNSVAGEFEPAATMKGHSGPVHSLVIGAGHGKLYSGSADCIKVWDQTLQCIQTIDGHSKEVTSLVCWDRYLMSASLDKRLKIWCATDSNSIEMIYEHQEDQGLVAMTIIDQPESRYLLLSLEDKSLCIFDFPLLVEKGRIYLEEASLVTQAGSDGLLFTGDAAGDVSVWNLDGVRQPLSE